MNSKPSNSDVENENGNSCVQAVTGKQSGFSVSSELLQRLICPLTKKQLVYADRFFQAADEKTITYPVVNGVPVLINEANSLFAIDDYLQGRDTTFVLKENRIKTALRSVLPKTGKNIKAGNNYRKLAGMLSDGAKILVIGGSVKGEGMDDFYACNRFEIVGTDVSFGPHIKIICDAHDIPFSDETFDCVIVQAVLEHVVDPYRCAEEFYRVLKPSGLIYAETPFMQPVHMRQYDFTRFTHLGHRRLFRSFSEISSGPVCGPGMALALSYKYFLRSFAVSPKAGRWLGFFAATTSFFLKYFDYFLIDRPGAYDAASGFFFMGRKSKSHLSDQELMSCFRGI